MEKDNKSKLNKLDIILKEGQQKQADFIDAINKQIDNIIKIKKGKNNN